MIKLSRWTSPGRRKRFKCHEKLSSVDSPGFCELCHITARRFNELAFRQLADRGAAFFASPDRWTLTGHDEIVLTVPSPGDGCEFWVTIK